MAKRSTNKKSGISVNTDAKDIKGFIKAQKQEQAKLRLIKQAKAAVERTNSLKSEVFSKKKR